MFNNFATAISEIDYQCTFLIFNDVTTSHWLVHDFAFLS